MRIYSTATQVHEDGCPTVVEYQRDNLAAVSVRIVTGNVAGRWHRLTEHDARNIVELLKDE